MSILKKIIPFVLIFCFLAGCGATGTNNAEANQTKEITITNDFIIAISKDDDTSKQAALSLQTTFDEKLRLNVLKIDYTSPSKNAIVLLVDSSMDAGSYNFTIEDTVLRVTASDSQVLLYAVKLLRQSLLDHNSTTITAEQCASLSGRTELLSFTFVSQNILFKNIEGGNTVNERAPRFQKLVYEYQPDIIGIQESSADWRYHYKSLFGKTYFAINQEGVTFLLRTNRYELVEEGFIYLSPTPDMKSQFEGDSGPRSCCWAIVKDKSTNKELFLCNPHLDWNNDTQRALQLEVMIEQLSSYFRQYPTIACGDYNSTPDGPIYARMTELLMDTRVSAPKNISTIDFTCHGFGKSTSTIDYIFHNEELVPELYYILNDDYGGYVSDHYGVLTNFHFAE